MSRYIARDHLHDMPLVYLAEASVSRTTCSPQVPDKFTILPPPVVPVGCQFHTCQM
jgi:hypothetical protein